MSSRSNPFEEIERMFERMSRQFSDVGRQFDQTGLRGMQSASMDVEDAGDEIVVTVDLPGYDKKNIDVTIDNQQLSVRAHRERDEEVSDERYLRRERSHQEVSRSIRLPEEVEEEQANATYNNGVLTIQLPKRSAGSEDRGRQIDIE
jgi:HSP20 family protein